MIDTALIQEYWWAGLMALAGVLALLTFFGIYRSKRRSAVKEISAREMPSQAKRDSQERIEELKREVEALRQMTLDLEKEIHEKTAQMARQMREQMSILEKAFSEKIAAQTEQSNSRDTKKDEKLVDSIHMLFPQITLLEKMEQFRQLNLTREEIRNIISDIEKRTGLVPVPIDLRTGEREEKRMGFFEKGILTLLAHRMHDIEKYFNARAGEESIYVSLGNAQYEESEYLMAKDYYEKALKENPSYALALYNLGVVFIQQGHYEEALKELEEALNLDPHNARGWYSKGIALGRIDRYEEALAAFGKALELNPHTARTWHSTGVVLAHLGRHEEALKAYENAIELNPDSADTWYNKGVTLIQLGLHEKALKAYEKAIRMKPGSADAWYNMGIALGRLGRYEEALRAYEKTLDLKPDFANAWYNKACLYSLQGDKNNALADLSKAIMINPPCRETAKEDEDFRNLLEDKDFEKVVS
ncbi:MAG: tetratricopeptide repeat protein [Thermodesulfovibrionales bacterium]|nr:tetratricopeptide repeat protein [Thermodesulfovibrionales bacterium]